jgi:hypothetical protein
MCIATAGPAVDGCHLLKLRRQIAASSRRSALHVVLETLVSRPQNSVVRPQQLSMPVCCLGTVGHPACRAWYSSAQLAHWWSNPWRHGLRSPYRYFLGSSRANSMHENVPSSWWPKPSSPLCVIHIPRNGDSLNSNHKEQPDTRKKMTVTSSLFLPKRIAAVGLRCRGAGRGEGYRRLSLCVLRPAGQAIQRYSSCAY